MSPDRRGLCNAVVMAGVFSGMRVFGKPPHWQDYAAIAPMFAALSLAMPAPLLRRRLRAGTARGDFT